ncbi:hypothetical protein AB0I10_34810 [Streptomyces sp. NPDC050636]|uniref:hypothetical protein n=1 Tax=Streptomyces sp. NPDC050636 TaxID=3154510 RepID=UPI003431DE61
MQQEMPFLAIARETGINRKTLATLADEYGIARRPHKPRGTLDREWLHEQYVVRRCTLTDIGRETGMSGTTVRARAREYGIPTQNTRQPRARRWLAQGEVRSPRCAEFRGALQVAVDRLVCCVPHVAGESYRGSARPVRVLAGSFTELKGGSPMDASYEPTVQHGEGEEAVWQRPDYTLVEAAPEVSGHSLTVR